MVFTAHLLATTSPLRCHLFAALFTLDLTLSCLATHAQVTPIPAPTRKVSRAEPICYVDGKLTAFSRFSKLDQSAISTMQVLTGEAEIKAFGSTTSGGTILVTTKAKAASPTVLAFNKRIADDVPLKPATPEQEAAITTAATYLAQSYPTAQLEGIYVLQTSPATYLAIFTQSSQRLSLYFDSNDRVMNR
jgi:hypothetical protein